MLDRVVLMIFLRPVEWSGELHLCNNRAEIFPCLLQFGDRLLSDGFLHGVHEKNSRSIVVANIKPLTIDRRRIVNLEEQLEQPRIRQDGWIKLHFDDLGVTGGMRADLLVGRILCGTARIPDLGRRDAFQSRERFLDSPEATCAKHRSFRTRFCVGLVEGQRGRINTIAQTGGGRRTVCENVPQMASATYAVNFTSDHPMAEIGFRADIFLR